ncbi:MAG: hypothetical protein RL660_787 [Bacteroidota bacterium]|jgi:site-specific recombinase XerD
MNITDYSIVLGEHRDQACIQFYFEKDLAKIKALKERFPVQFSSSKKMWYLKDLPQYRSILGIPLKEHHEAHLPRVHPINQAELKKYYQYLQQKAFSKSTLRSYTAGFALFLRRIKGTPAHSFTPERINSYFHYCITKLGYTESTVHSHINAIKLYYEQVLHREQFMVNVPRPNKPSKLPKALSKADVKKLFAVIDNPKHKLMLQLVYGMGLRVSEIIALKLEHINSADMQVLIANAKGKKDRMVNLPYTLLNDLREYYKLYRPQVYLFEGQVGGQYSARSAQQVFKTAMLKAGINKTIGIHGLRHSYATHLLQAGTDISFIQQLLGHTNINTTLVYTQVANNNVRHVASPLDTL